MLAGALGGEGAQRGHHVPIHHTGPAWTLVSTSPHAYPLRPRLLSLLAIQFTILITLSVVADATVLTIQSISSAVRCSQGPRDLHRPPRPTTDIVVTSVRARAPRAQPRCTSLHRPPLKEKPRYLHCRSLRFFKPDLLMHPPSFAHTKFIPLLQSHHKLFHSRQHLRALCLPSLQSRIATSLAALVRVRHQHSTFT